MAFARFGPDSDIYVYDDDDGFCCERCPEVGKSFSCKCAPEMVKHLFDHLAKGHKVPPDAIDELRSWPPKN